MTDRIEWLPWAIKRPLHFIDTLPDRDDSAEVCGHTNGGPSDNGSLFLYFDRAGNRIASHVQIMDNGEVEQYIPFTKQAFAEFAGNPHAVAIECQDDAETKPMTDKQVHSFIRICHDLGIPGRVGGDHGKAGVAWHSLYDDWNENHHNCPGAPRVAQLHHRVIPALGAARNHPHPTHEHARLLKLEEPPMHGDDVRKLQYKLNFDDSHGPAIEVDGVFGPDTADAVKHFQRHHWPENASEWDGIVGPATRRALGL